MERQTEQLLSQQRMFTLCPAAVPLHRRTAHLQADHGHQRLANSMDGSTSTGRAVATNLLNALGFRRSSSYLALQRTWRTGEPKPTALAATQ
jgi:hypothetical protein